MGNKEVKTAELSGAALDWAVAEAIGWKEPIFGVGLVSYIEEDRYLIMETPDPDEPHDVTRQHHFNHYQQWSPSRIWSQGGPLIDAYQAYPNRFDDECPGVEEDKRFFVLTHSMKPSYGTDFNSVGGPTALIAACRAIAAAKLGDTVQVPEELLG